MPDNELTKDADFKVGEAVFLDLGIGFFFFFLFFYAILNDHVDSYSISQKNVFSKSLYITLIPAVIFTLKGFLNRISIRINKSGIYYYSKLVTNWNNFISAEIVQEEIVGSTQDNFVLLIEYSKDDEKGYFQRKIALTNTQNKSEEEVLAAISFFFDNSKA
jgi:hypothetical protein